MNLAKCQLAVCPYCGEKKEIIRLLSGNTFGSVLWSDAKEVMPMCPSASPIQKCPRCGHFYFLEKVLLKEGDKYSEQKGWLDFEDALKANVELSSLSIEQEGHRANSIFKLACLMCKWGIDKDLVIEYFVDGWKSLTMNEDEIMNHVINAYKAEADNFGTLQFKMY